MTVRTDTTFDVRTDRRLIRPTAHSQRFVLARIAAPRATTERVRPAVNLAIVLDRSGSMSGEKIRVAKDAVEEAIARLRPDDRFSVVVYDDVVEVVSGSTEERKFVAFYGRGGRIVGVLGMSQPAKVMRWRSLVEEGASWETALATAKAAA